MGTPDSLTSGGDPVVFACAMLGSACETPATWSTPATSSIFRTLQRPTLARRAARRWAGGATSSPSASGWASFCSETCLRAAQSAQRKRRWRARRRAMKVAVIGVAVAGACLAPHQGREGLRPLPVARAPRAAVRGRRGAGGPGRAGSGPSGRRRTPACWPPWGATPGFIRWRGPFAACPATTRACSAPCGRGIARSNAATATAASIWAARSGASTSAPSTTAWSNTFSAARTRSAAASSCASPTAAAP